MGQRVLSTHFLKRRATKRAEQLRRWLKDARRHPDTLRGMEAKERLDKLDIPTAAGWHIVVLKRGKWDARYDVTLV